MPLLISDATLNQAGMTENEALIEFACFLFNSDRVGKFTATKMVGMTRSEFERELMRRNLPIYRLTEQQFAEDLATLERLGF